MKEKRFFPLDRKLQLRRDSWSEGAARVAVRQGLQARSFALGAESYEDAVGSGMSRDSLRRLTEGWGQACVAQREADVAGLYALNPAEEKAVTPVDPIQQQASLATDGGLMLVRGEGWKEVKMVTISAVRRRGKEERACLPDGRRYAPWEPAITLERHSYQAALCDADEMEGYQYLEGCRRGLLSCQQVSAVGDAARWIGRVTETNFPHVTQIVDWFHAAERLWLVGKSCISEETQRKRWVQKRLDDLWAGQPEQVVTALTEMDLPQHTDEEQVLQAPGYFARHKERMRYHQYRVKGYPIGSGTVESGINIVVHHRLKRQGRGWTRPNGQGMLAALSELHSGRFTSTWYRTHAVA